WIIQKIIASSQLSTVKENKEHLEITIDRRILTYHSLAYHSKERDEESIRLLKKIADIEIEDFPSHILEKIRSTWENWNSPRFHLIH
ncbi:hypothetical protein Gotur_024537, partial [Gossypium turneri]